MQREGGVRLHRARSVLVNRLTIRSGEELAEGFQRIPNRRVLPDYFEVISEPVAFSTIRVRLVYMALDLRRSS